MDLKAPSKRESQTIWRGAMNSTAGFATDVQQFPEFPHFLWWN